jgi:hypothetical protein
MQTIGIILLLISIGTVVGPVGATVIVYRDDLSQLVITPQIRDIMNGNSNIFPHGNNGNQNSNGGDSGFGGLMSPTFVSAQSDPSTHTFTGIFTVTNNFTYPLTLNSFNANAQITQQQIPAGSVSLANPVTVQPGQTTQLTISGQWSQQAQDYMVANSPSMTSVEIYVSDVAININGITVQSTGTIDVGNIPFNILG